MNRRGRTRLALWCSRFDDVPGRAFAPATRILRFDPIRRVGIVLPNVIPDFEKIAESVRGESVKLFHSPPARRDDFISRKR
jgi:hypothetical protein